MNTQAKIGLVVVVVLILVVAVVWDRQVGTPPEYPGTGVSEIGNPPADNSTTPTTPGTGTQQSGIPGEVIPARADAGIGYPSDIYGDDQVSVEQTPVIIEGGFPTGPRPGTTPVAFGPRTDTQPIGTTGNIGQPLPATFSGPGPSFSSNGFPSTSQPGFGPSTTLDASTESAGATRTYTVVDGDSFWTISQKVYGSGKHFQFLQEANKSRVPNPDRMKLGQELVIPPLPEKATRGSSGSTSSPVRASAGTSHNDDAPLTLSAGSVVHRVTDGESLYSIAARYYGKGSLWPKIFEANRDVLPNENSLSPGQRLVIPPAPTTGNGR